jgi:hypothetical protein
MKFFFTIMLILFSVNGYAKDINSDDSADYFVSADGSEHKLCSHSDLNNCLENKGGNACFDDFCVVGFNSENCKLNDFKKCLDDGGGFACEDHCGDGGEDYVHVYPYRFPINGDPPQFFTGVRSFGSWRNRGKRLHAAVDLEEPVGKEIYAVANGTVVDYYDFYRGTMALVVDHGEFVVRYGEIKRKTKGIKIGAKIQKGQLIGRIGKLIGMGRSMLHFEMYSGDAQGPLTVYSGKYRRRKDLIDPTDRVESWRALKPEEVE